MREDFFYLLGRHIGNMAKGEVIKVKERFYTHEEYMDENTEEGLATAAKITDLPLGEKPAVEWGELSRQLSSRKSDMEEDILDVCGKGDSYFTRIEKPRAKAEFDRVLDLVIDMYEDRVMKQERGVDHFMVSSFLQSVGLVSLDEVNELGEIIFSVIGMKIMEILREGTDDKETLKAIDFQEKRLYA